jgi:hypothetical protein
LADIGASSMIDYVWMCKLPKAIDGQRMLNSFFTEDTSNEEALRATTRAIQMGSPISAEQVPAAIFGAPDAEERHYKLPHLFYAYGFSIVSKAAADVLQQFDLGGGGLYPVKSFKKDRVTPIDGEWFCVNFGNVKHAFAKDQSANMIERYIRDGRKGWFPRPSTVDMDFAFTSAATVGPDIWLDYDVGDVFLLSAALGDALKKAKADKGFKLTKCRVV